MQDTFQWTDELVGEYANLFIKESWEQLGLLKKNITSVEQFKSSKSPKKEWEIVEVFAEGGDLVPAYAPQGWTEEWIAEKIKNGSIKIHSIRRLSDGEVFSVGENFLSGGGLKEKIISFEIHGNDMWVWFSCGSNSMQYIMKLPQPILTTVDGVGLHEGQTAYFVSQDFGLGCATVVDDPALNNRHTIFSTREAAEEYILNNRPLLSLNDVKEQSRPNYGETIDISKLIERLTLLVTLKLNQ